LATLKLGATARRDHGFTTEIALSIKQPVFESTHELEESEMKELKYAVLSCIETFHQHKKELEDLRSSFWDALSDLQAALLFDSDEEIIAKLKKHKRALGAPGDFGYGTPCGDALRAVYEAWGNLHSQTTG